MARLLLAIPGAMRSARGARPPAMPKGPPDALNIRRATDGGHIVEHQYDNAPGMGRNPTFTFGAGQGQQMLNHVAQAMNVGGSRPTAAPKVPGGGGGL